MLELLKSNSEPTLTYLIHPDLPHLYPPNPEPSHPDPLI
jgi:hypothetical protein